MVVEHVGRRLADVKRARRVGVAASVSPADVDVDLLAGHDHLAARERMARIRLRPRQHRQRNPGIFAAGLRHQADYFAVNVEPGHARPDRVLRRLQPSAFNSCRMKAMPSQRLSIGKVRKSSAQVTTRHMACSLGVSNMMNLSWSACTAMPLVAGHCFGLCACYHSRV